VTQKELREEYETTIFALALMRENRIMAGKGFNAGFAAESVREAWVYADEIMQDPAMSESYRRAKAESHEEWSRWVAEVLEGAG
jgi:hypothetical protein